MRQVIQLRRRIEESSAKNMAGKPLTMDMVSIMLENDADVYAPDGTPVLKLRRGALSEEVNESAYESLHWMRDRYKSDNRASYAGGTAVQKGNSKSTRSVDENGKNMAVRSAIIGYFDKQGGRWPFCRATAFTAQEVARWNKVIPMIKEASELFRSEVPERFKAQMEHASKVHPDYIIPGTPFSTLTVNNNVTGAIHKDKGDLETGFGVISCLRRGEYTGGTLAFPQYGVGVDLRDRDVIFFDAHAWHGVTKMVHADPANEGERITVVYYLRTKIIDCESADAERERTKRQQGGIQ